MIARIKPKPSMTTSDSQMIEPEASMTPQTRRRVRVTAWSVGLVAAAIYLGSILQIVLHR